MSTFTESIVEDAALAWLSGLGYKVCMALASQPVSLVLSAATPTIVR